MGLWGDIWRRVMGHDKHHEHDDHDRNLALWDIVQSLREIARDIRGIRAILTPNYPVQAVFTQGANMLTGTIKGLAPGGSDTFFVTLIDANGNADQLPKGSPVPTITVDDTTNITLVVAADGQSTQATAATTAPTSGSFNLTYTANFTKVDGTAGQVVKTVNVPFLAPPALDPVDAVWSQGSPAA